MEQPSFEELLRVSMDKLRQGHSYRAILNGLQQQGADEAHTRQIISALKQAEKSLKIDRQARVIKAQRFTHLRKGILQLSGGLLLVLLGWSYYQEGSLESYIFLIPVTAGIIGLFVAFSGCMHLIAAGIKRK